MKRYFCDKCGKEMTKEQYSKHFFDISKYIFVERANHIELVLCEECENKLFKWLGVTDDRKDS